MKPFLNRRVTGHSAVAAPSVAPTQVLVEVAGLQSVQPALRSGADGDEEAGPVSQPDTLDTIPSPTVSSLHSVPPMSAHLAGRPIQNADARSVEKLIPANGLVTFRSFSTFACIVSLFFHSSTMQYFVTFHQESLLWYALKASDPDAADAAFAQLEEQAVRLSEGEMRRVQLLIGNACLARKVAEAQAQAERLRADLQRHAEREHQVGQRLQKERREATQLEAQRIALQAQLNKAHRDIRQLEIASNETVPRLYGK